MSKRAYLLIPKGNYSSVSQVEADSAFDFGNPVARNKADICNWLFNAKKIRRVSDNPSVSGTFDWISIFDTGGHAEEFSPRGADIYEFPESKVIQASALRGFSGNYDYLGSEAVVWPVAFSAFVLNGEWYFDPGMGSKPLISHIFSDTYCEVTWAYVDETTVTDSIEIIETYY